MLLREGQNPRRLHAVAVIENPSRSAYRAYFFDGLYNARFVVGVHYRAEHGILPQGALNAFGAHRAVFIGFYKRYFIAVTLHIVCAFYKRRVLYCGNDDVFAPSAGARAFKRPVARFRSARNKKDLVPLTAEEGRYFIARGQNALRRTPSRGVLRRRIAEIFF